MQISYTSKFIKQYSKFNFELKEEIKEKINLFETNENYERLKIHKLHGRLKNKYSFSVNYKLRIVFQYLPKKSKRGVVFLAIGQHTIYH